MPRGEVFQVHNGDLRFNSARGFCLLGWSRWLPQLAMAVGGCRSTTQAVRCTIKCSKGAPRTVRQTFFQSFVERSQVKSSQFQDQSESDHIIAFESGDNEKSKKSTDDTFLILSTRERRPEDTYPVQPFITGSRRRAL